MSDVDLKLTIELIPSTAWNMSLYQYYKQNKQAYKWKMIKQELFEKEGRQCWICGKKGGHLEAHEFWEYDDENHVQELSAVHHLCKKCHMVKHIGYWCHSFEGLMRLEEMWMTEETLIKHFCKVNMCDVEAYEQSSMEARLLWEERSKYDWEQDISLYF